MQAVKIIDKIAFNEDKLEPLSVSVGATLAAFSGLNLALLHSISTRTLDLYQFLLNKLLLPCGIGFRGNTIKTIQNEKA